MRPVEIFRSVFYSVRSNKFRVFLTSLGIIIGSFTIIMVVGIGKASEDSVSEQYKRLSVETITISANMNMRMPSSSVTSLTKDQAVAMEDELEYVSSVGVSTSSSTTIAYGTTSETISVQGINEAYAEITNLELAAGEFFTDEDGEARNKVVVLGSNIVELLFYDKYDDYEDCIGEKVMIKGLSFTVVGILERIGGTGGVSSGGREGSTSSDDMVFIPYDVAIKYTSGSTSVRGGGIAISIMSGSSTSFVAMANSIDVIDLAIAEIKEYIGDVTGDSGAYNVADAGSTLSSALETSNTMSMLLIAVAVIVLVVSGIGIMNVLMVSVKERVKEIGILKSIGAAKWIILTEFLLEAIFISIFGGIFGVVLSVLVPNILEYVGISYAASFNGILLGFGFSVVTGVFFGFYPAYKASKLKPIDALNAE